MTFGVPLPPVEPFYLDRDCARRSLAAVTRGTHGRRSGRTCLRTVDRPSVGRDSGSLPNRIDSSVNVDQLPKELPATAETTERNGFTVV